MANLVMWEKQEIRNADELLQVLKSVQATSEANLMMEEIHLYSEGKSVEISLTNKHCVFKIATQDDQYFHYVIQNKKSSQQMFYELGEWSPSSKISNENVVYWENDVDFLFCSHWIGHPVDVFSTTIISADDGARLCVDFFYGDLQLPNGWTKMSHRELSDALSWDQESRGD